MDLTIDALHTGGHIALECLSGSRAYGLEVPGSDTDIKGVFILPKEIFYGLEYTGELSNESNDVTYYELQKFFDLLLKNNPTALEVLCTGGEAVRYRHPLMELIKPEMFISKLCCKSFAGYALAQVKRARGLNKKIVNPMEPERKGVLDFCYVPQGQGSVPVAGWLQERDMQQEHCGLSSLPHMPGLYALYYDEKAKFRGIVSKESSNEVSLSSIPQGMEPVAVMSFNKDAYQRYCREYKEYWDWVKKRNEARYENNVAHGKNYDSKNMMHTFRLLTMAEEIATKGYFTVRRPEREYFLSIRKGEY